MKVGWCISMGMTSPFSFWEAAVCASTSAELMVAAGLHVRCKVYNHSKFSMGQLLGLSLLFSNNFRNNRQYWE